MKAYKTNDGKIYPLFELLPVQSTLNKQDGIDKLTSEHKELEIKYNNMMNEMRKLSSVMTNKRSEIEKLQKLNGTSLPVQYETVDIPVLKLLSILGYKHVTMPDAFPLGRSSLTFMPNGELYYLSFDDIKTQIHGKTIIYSRKPTQRKIWSGAIRDYKTTDYTWVASIKANRIIHNIFYKQDELNFGNPGNPMKLKDLKEAISGIFYIDRRLNYKETKTMLISEMMKRILKGK